MKQTKLDRIATMCNQQKKPNKKEICDLIKHLADQGNNIQDSEIATLYGYFMDSVPATPKTAFQWVAKAMAKKDTREYLNYVYCDGPRLIATDGHRLHVHALPGDHGYEKGFYGKNESYLYNETYGRFPDIDRVIPSYNTKDTTTLTFSDLPVGDNGTWGQTILLGKDCYVARKYLLDAIGKSASFQVLNGANIGPTQAVLIDCKFGQTVIMPVRMD